MTLPKLVSVSPPSLGGDTDTKADGKYLDPKVEGALLKRSNLGLFAPTPRASHLRQIILDCGRKSGDGGAVLRQSAWLRDLAGIRNQGFEWRGLRGPAILYSRSRSPGTLDAA
jgi:hypothetical protein